MTNRTAAARYARAILDVAVKERADLERIDRELPAFADLVKGNAALEHALLNPAVAAPKKKAAVVQLVERAGLSSIVAKVLGLLAERDRLILLPDLVAAYHDRLLEYRRIVRAEVTTAAPIAEPRAKAIQASLAKATGRTVVLETKVDPSIVGGMIAKVGSTVYDGSVTRQLARLRARLTEM
ncbi:MAG TPA: ATP synthase F1 subunit delta [Vicinamibacterales bacterium]